MDELPLVALPELMNLLEHFDKSLDLAAIDYKNNHNEEEFKKILNSHGADLVKYVKNVDAWSLLNAPPDKKEAIKQIEIKIANSQAKLNKAIALLKPSK